MLLILLFSALVTGLSGLKYYFWYHKSQIINEPVEFNLTRGMSFNEFLEQLFAANLINSKLSYGIFLKLTRQYPHFKAGLYLFEHSISPAKLTEIMTSGRTYNKLIMEVNFPEGFTLNQILNRLMNFPLKEKESLKNLAYSREFCENLGIKANSLEGFFYPATYRFYNEYPTSKEVLTRGVQEFFRRLPANFINSLAQKNLTLEEAVIFASLIEKETGIEEEKPKVSEVIWRRLKDGMPLGIDASIIYGIEDYKGDLRTVHLRDRTNPYNTRIHPGLPPSPIGSPTLSSLEAVLNPTNEGHYYYVLSPDGDRKHIFAKTLGEHNLNVRRLVKSLKNAQK